MERVALILCLCAALPQPAAAVMPTNNGGGVTSEPQAPVLPPATAVVPGTTTITASVPVDHMRGWLAASLMTLPPARLTVKFGAAECLEFAYACISGATISMSGRNCGFPKRFWRSCRLIFMHEIGHAVDSATLDDAERQRFSDALHIARGWFDTGFGFRPDSAAERFADAWAMCAVGSRNFRFRINSRESDTLVLRANAGRYERLCALIKSFQ